MRYSIFILSFFLVTYNSNAQIKEMQNKDKKEKQMISIIEIITFLSKDGLPIKADFYPVKSLKPMILLCHQAGFSRGEYINTAVALNKLGYTCLAIDQRSGNEANGIMNETAVAAKKRKLPTTYLDAKQDIKAAIDFLYEKNNNKPIIVVGSSYSATLVLLIGENSNKVKAIAAFSPGEYYKTINVKETIKNMKKQVFVTSSKKEAKALTKLVSLINLKNVVQFIPEVDGIHGSRALWKSTNGNESYWKAFIEFLQKNSES